MGFVYIFTNKWMPELVKIGYTDTSIQQRLREARGTWVPGQFDCSYALETEKFKEVELYVHMVMKSLRVQVGGVEFFQMNLGTATEILGGLAKLIDARVVPQEELDIAFQALIQTDGVTAAPVYERSDNANFEMLGIPVGSRLSFIGSGEVCICETVDNKNHVLFEGRTYSLSGLAVKLKGYSVNGYQVFKYHDDVVGDEVLTDRRQRLAKQEAAKDSDSAG
jgi:hypothetical protein